MSAIASERLSYPFSSVIASRAFSSSLGSEMLHRDTGGRFFIGIGYASRAGGENPKSEIRNPKSEVRSPKSEVRSPKSEVRSPQGRANKASLIPSDFGFRISGFPPTLLLLPTPSMSVAVVIPLFNHERYIADALRGLLAQTRPPDRIIVIDDGSSDGSLDAARSVADPRITLLTQQ